MLDLDGIAKAVNYPPASLDSLSPDQLDRLSFLGYPERYGFVGLDVVFPKNARYGKLDPPPSYLSSACVPETPTVCGSLHDDRRT